MPEEVLLRRLRLTTEDTILRSKPCGFRAKDGGAEGIRTPDPHNAIVVLYQLSYDPDQSAENLNNSRRLSKGFFPGELEIHECQRFAHNLTRLR